MEKKHAKRDSLIKVTWPDGEEICYRRPVHTMLAVLKKIGAPRLSEITLKIGERPLVSKEVYPELKKYTKEIIPGWYYINRSDTKEKQLQLISINRKLGLELKIEAGEDFSPTPDPQGIRNGRACKKRIEVTLPDGELIDYDSYKDVFYTCIDKLGARKISLKANFPLTDKSPLLTPHNTENCPRVKIDETLYLAIPNGVDAAAKFLRLIALRLGVGDKMKIDIIEPNREID